MPRYSEPFRLTTGGSIRATSYAFSNKSITLNGKTNVVWLDRPATVCGRVYDHATNTWSETLRLFEGSDNHTSPALIADHHADPHLRLVLGPHGAGWNGGQFKWAISEQPGKIDAWKWHYSFGYAGTYPCIVTTPQGHDAFVYRGGEWPPSLMFQRQKSVRHWTKAREIFWQDVGPQYTHYGAYIDCDANGTLYVAAHFYTSNMIPDHPDNYSRGCAIVKSTNLGESWTTMSGEPIVTPALCSDHFAAPTMGEPNMNIGGLAIDSKGTPWVVTFNAGTRIRSVFVSRWINGKWETSDAGTCLPSEFMACDTSLTIDSKDRLHMAVTALKPATLHEKGADAWWGHGSCEMFHVMSADAGKSWRATQISKADPKFPNWLPTITRNSIHHRVDTPLILYTHGHPGLVAVPGKTELEEAQTEVYAVFVYPD